MARPHFSDFRVEPRVWQFVFAAVGCGVFAGCAAKDRQQSTIAVAAAADLKFAFDELAEAFHRQHPEIQVKPTYGSSGHFTSQLENKAPFDLFLSADVDYPRRLIEEGRAPKGSEFVYAVGHIVLWTRKDSKLDLDKLGADVLVDPSVKKIAIANPKHAPYGRAAVAALKKLSIYGKVQDRLVLGENVSQATQFVQTGAADIGIIGLAQAQSPSLKDAGRCWKIPAIAYPRIEQGGIILNWAADRSAAESLRDFILSSEGQAILQKYGFSSAATPME